MVVLVFFFPKGRLSVCASSKSMWRVNNIVHEYSSGVKRAVV